MSSFHHLPRDHESFNLINNKEIQESEINEFCENNNNEAAFGKSLESIHIRSDGQVFVASSNVQGPTLDGFVTKYLKTDDIPLMPILSLNPSFGGCADLICTRDRRIVCCFDSGHISLLNDELEQEACQAFHDNEVNQININKLENKIVSCGRDASIIVWDLHTFVPIKVFTCAHSASVSNVDVNVIDDNMLLSCAQDHNVLLWDIRLPKPASKLVSLVSEPTSLCWLSRDASHAIVGTDSGHLLLFDVRRPGLELNLKSVCSKRIHRVKSVLNGGAIAVCADDCSFHLCNTEVLDIIYKSADSHTDWVRDACEFEGRIYTVGRDTQLVCHTQTTSL